MQPDIRPPSAASARALLGYCALGTIFGIVLTKSEVISWFRIQEMFRFQAFHMYGIIGSAVAVAFAGLQLIRRLGARTLGGALIVLPPKTLGTGARYWLGGTMFGLGWALVGASGSTVRAARKWHRRDPCAHCERACRHVDVRRAQVTASALSHV